MFLPPDPLEIHPAGFIRRRCRNPRCIAKLKRETDRPRDAFCCAGCFEQYFRTICLVCERPMRQKAAQQRFCSNRCRSTFRRHPEQFWSRFTPPARGVADATRKALGSAHSTGLKTGTKRGRPPRIVAGPGTDLDPINLAIDAEAFAHVRRLNHRHWAEVTLIGPRDWPINGIGGSDYAHRLAHEQRAHPKRKSKI
jgi:hypothetical protein